MAGARWLAVVSALLACFFFSRPTEKMEKSHGGEIRYFSTNIIRILILGPFSDHVACSEASPQRRTNKHQRRLQQQPPPPPLRNLSATLTIIIYMPFLHTRQRSINHDTTAAGSLPSSRIQDTDHRPQTTVVLLHDAKI